MLKTIIAAVHSCSDLKVLFISQMVFGIRLCENKP